MTDGKRIVDDDSESFYTCLCRAYPQGYFPFDKPVKFYILDPGQAFAESKKSITNKPIIRLES
jgi:hypothetical protein